jgi:hypothetical protein
MINDNSRDNRLFFVDCNKNTLLLTVGDSWTWGDSLGDVSTRYRSNHVYGKYLSDYLNADWINYGYCGGGNNDTLLGLDLILQYVIDDYGFNLSRHKYNFLASSNWPDYDTFYSSVKQYPNIVNEIKNFIIPNYDYLTIDYETLSPLITKKYQNIYIVITLTETGRDSYDTNAKNHFTNLKNFLIDDETYVYQKITKLKERYSNINLVVARNFSCDFPETKNSLCIEKNWIQINFEENQKKGFDNHFYRFEDINKTGAVSSTAFNQITKKLNYDDQKQYIIDQIDSVDKVWHWLRNNPLNYNYASCHPTEESHRLWANYLKQYLK